MLFRELANPPPEFRIWGALEADIQYVIVLDIEDDTYSASYKLRKWNNKKAAVYIGEGLATFDQAKDACLMHQASISTKN